MGRGAIYKSFTNNTSELDILFGLQFKDCAARIAKMDTIKKAEVAAKIQPVLDSLYLQADRYGNSDYERDEQIGPDMFILLMGKIKRWETILYWLYEIDIMMQETKLDELIREAEKRFIEEGYSNFATRIRVKEIETEDGQKRKKRVIVNVKEDLATLQAERNARENHTEEIMSMAKSLASKYFK